MMKFASSRWRPGTAAAVLLSGLLFTGGSPFAAPVSCHCFRDRTFDPASPAKTDPYLLATTQNSFFAVVFGIPKRAVVQAKMKGVSGDDLWTAYYAGSTLRLPPGNLMLSKERSGSWKAALENRGVPLAPLGERFLDLLDRGADEGDLAAAAAGEVLVRSLSLPRAELDPLLARRPSTGRIVTASLLSLWSGRTAASILSDVDSGRTTWGSLMNGLGIRPDGLEEKIHLLIGTSQDTPRGR